MSAESTRRTRGSNAGWIAGAILAALLVAAVLLFLLRDREQEPEVAEAPTATETASAAASPAALPTGPTETPTTETPTAAPTPSETAPPADADPTEQDIADFVDAHGPADRTATGDVTGDGTDEVVLTSIRNNAVRIVVGLWDGAAYQRAFRDDGGPAERITALEVGDYNGVAGAEIVTEQRAGAEGRSISVWGVVDGGIARQEGKGGCWDGFHTYGISGASIAPGEITATCDGSPQPPEAWSSDVYEWKKGRWTYARTQEAAG